MRLSLHVCVLFIVLLFFYRTICTITEDDGQIVETQFTPQKHTAQNDQRKAPKRSEFSARGSVGQRHLPPPTPMRHPTSPIDTPLIPSFSFPLPPSCIRPLRRLVRTITNLRRTSAFLDLAHVGTHQRLAEHAQTVQLRYVGAVVVLDEDRDRVGPRPFGCQ